MATAESCSNVSCAPATLAEHVLFFLFGMYPWLSVNAFFTQSAIFAHSPSIPEGKNISAILGSVVQIANAVALAYVVADRRWSFRKHYVSLILILLGITSTILAACLWSESGYILGKHHSIALILTSFVAGIVGSTSMAVIFAFSGRFKQSLTGTVSIGNGFSGVITTAIGAIQGEGEETVRFSVSTFFIIITVVQLVSLAALYEISFGPRRKRYVVVNPEQIQYDTINTVTMENSGQDVDEEELAAAPLLGERMRVSLARERWLPSAHQLWTSLANYAIIPGLYPYILPGQQGSFLVILLVNVAGVIGRWLCRVRQYYAETWLNTAQTGAFLLLVLPATGVMTIPPILCGAVVLICGVLNGYTTTLVFYALRRDLRGAECAKYMSFCGLANQIGALLGTFSTDVLLWTNALH